MNPKLIIAGAAGALLLASPAFAGPLGGTGPSITAGAGGALSAHPTVSSPPQMRTQASGSLHQSSGASLSTHGASASAGASTSTALKAGASVPANAAKGSAKGEVRSDAKVSASTDPQ